MKAIQKFGMHNCKPVSVPLVRHFVLIKSQSPTSNVEIFKMENVPYVNAIGTIMYVTM